MVSDPHTMKNLFKDPLDLMLDPRLKSHLQHIKTEQSFDLVSATSLNKPLTIKFYKNWIANRQHGDMNYLENRELDSYITTYLILLLFALVIAILDLIKYRKVMKQLKSQPKAIHFRIS